MMTAVDILVTSVCVVTGLVVCVRGNLIVYPHADILPPSTRFSVKLTQGGPTFPSFTYISTSNHRVKDASSVKPNRSVSWTSFAFTAAPVTVDIHTARSFNQCYVRPRSYSISCHKVSSNVARFDVLPTASRCQLNSTPTRHLRLKTSPTSYSSLLTALKIMCP